MGKERKERRGRLRYRERDGKKERLRAIETQRLRDRDGYIQRQRWKDKKIQGPTDTERERDTERHRQ